MPHSPTDSRGAGSVPPQGGASRFIKERGKGWLAPSYSPPYRCQTIIKGGASAHPLPVDRSAPVKAFALMRQGRTKAQSFALLAQRKTQR
jgi:hypothetical protein